jgi:hypothetical protein
MFFCVLMFSQITWSGEWTFDFEDAAQAKQWKVANGTWKIQKGVYSETEGAEKAGHVLFGEDDWTDYTVEAKIRIDSNKWVGLVFRAISEYEYYVLYQEPSPGVTAFFQHHGDVWDKRARPVPNKTPIKIKKGDNIEAGEWYHLKIVVEGNDLKWFINDQLQAETKLKRVGDLAVYDKGKVGLWAWQSKASFDDFKVYGPDIEGQAVEPQNKLTVTWGKLKKFH